MLYKQAYGTIELKNRKRCFGDGYEKTERFYSCHKQFDDKRSMMIGWKISWTDKG